MASTVTHVVTVVGFVLFISCFNVSYAKSIKVDDYINKYHNKTRLTDYQCIRFTKFASNALRKFVPCLCVQTTVAFEGKKSVQQLRGRTVQ
jgi:hypothetical protein